MQKDFHFYLTYALCVRLSLPPLLSQQIAWANQYTDELSEADIFGIQTQSKLLGNWHDHQIQHSVLVPFHFLPGDEISRPWKTTADSRLAHILINDSIPDCFQFGIALHSLQDTFSHEGFSGWNDKENAAYPWYYIESTLPNVGHAELRALPDIVNLTWTDPRTGESVNNQVRALDAAEATYKAILKFTEGYHKINVVSSWDDIAPCLEDVFKLESYEDRKTFLRNMALVPDISFKHLSGSFRNLYRKEFIEAARKHLSLVLGFCSNLPIK